MLSMLHYPQPVPSEEAHDAGALFENYLEADDAFENY